MPDRIDTEIDQIVAPPGRTFCSIDAELRFSSEARRAVFVAYLGSGFAGSGDIWLGELAGLTGGGDTKLDGQDISAFAEGQSVSFNFAGDRAAAVVVDVGLLPAESTYEILPDVPDGTKYWKVVKLVGSGTDNFLSDVVFEKTVYLSGAYADFRPTGVFNIEAGGAVVIVGGALGSMDNVAIGGTTPAAGAFTTLSATGEVQFSAGSVGTPVVNFGNASGDTNTGFYRAGADSFDIAAGGLNAATFTSALVNLTHASGSQVQVSSRDGYARLNVAGTSGSTLAFTNASTDEFAFYADSAGNIFYFQYGSGGSTAATYTHTEWSFALPMKSPAQTVAALTSVMTLGTMGGSEDYIVFREDFIGGTNTSGQIGTHGWRIGTNGVMNDTVTGCAYVGSEQHRPGIYQIASGAVSGNSKHATITGSGIAQIPMYTGTKAKFVFRVNSTASIGIFVGLANDSGGMYAATRCLGIRADTTDGDTAFFVIHKDGGAESKTATGVAFATGWHCLEIEITATNSTATVTIDGTVVLIAEKVFVSAGAGFPVFEVKTRTSSAKNLDCDFFAYHQTLTR